MPVLHEHHPFEIAEAIDDARDTPFHTKILRPGPKDSVLPIEIKIFDFRLHIYESEHGHKKVQDNLASIS